LGNDGDEDCGWDAGAALSGFKSVRRRIRHEGGDGRRTPSTSSVNVFPSSRPAHPCRTLGGPSMHQILILHNPVHLESSDQTCEPRSLCDRMVSSRKGAFISRITARRQRRGCTKVESRSEEVPCRMEDPRGALGDSEGKAALLLEKKGIGKKT
jgi:hypothetical protein